MKKIGLTLIIFLSTVECKKIINSFEDNKSPGIDGLGKSFYSRFWLIIGKDLVEVLLSSKLLIIFLHSTVDKKIIKVSPIFFIKIFSNQDVLNILYLHPLQKILALTGLRYLFSFCFLT
jgi:hypothetical protein